ncbi:hypothetical protein ACUXCL_002077 [Staphylococcus saprophyticus]
MIKIISAIGSIGTFVMALFYFVSVSIQLYQMKVSFYQRWISIKF